VLATTRLASDRALKLCYVSKYPPIQGGVSRQNFWMARALADRGIEVHVVTNAPEVEQAFRIVDLDAWVPDPDAPPYSGSGVSVHATRFSRQHLHIPGANPFVTKLSALAADVVREHGCDLILGGYFEPYGMAAHLASHWTGVPYGLRHAGSDVGRLLQAPELRTAYREMLLGADFILTGGPAALGFRTLGVEEERIYPELTPGLPRPWFRPDGPVMDLPRVIEAVRSHLPPGYLGGVTHRFTRAAFDPSRPTLGIYGKAGEAKGTFDLIAALGRLNAAGIRFNFVAFTQGWEPVIREVAEAVEAAGIESCAWLLPFIPHWRIPAFLRACTAVCFLERDFPIKLHAPQVPREAVACGTCLILSQEILEKQPDRARFRDGHNVLVVEPRDAHALDAALRRALAGPDEAREIGRRGHEEIDRGVDRFTAPADRMAAGFREIHEDVTARREASGAPAIHPARSLKGNREAKLRAHFPLLYQCVPEPQMRRHCSRFSELDSEHPYEPLSAALARFGLFMEETLATDPDAPPYAADVARYERLSRAVMSHLGEDDRINQAPEPPAPISAESRPRLAETVRLGLFRRDVIRVVDQLRNGAEVTEATGARDGRHFVVLQRLREKPVPKVFRVNEPTFFLLEQCAGRLTRAELAERCEQHFGVRGLGAQLRAMLDDLAARGLIRA
jgi:glycosyltransferase involved in cell wall biosynthesis